MTTVVVALVASTATGFLGAWLGAWLSSTHDRRERLRARRIDAADELIVALSDALLKLSEAITFYDEGKDEQAESLMIEELVNVAVTKSGRVDLLFVLGSPVSENANQLFSQLRKSLALAKEGKIQEAKQMHGDASVTMAWLTFAASDAIRTTGRRSDRFKTLRKLEKEAPELQPGNRRRGNGGNSEPSPGSAAS